MTENVRVRFAPSPTGALHIGGARTAIYNWAFARRHGGTFVLRIEDTDPERSTKENTEQILRSLEWLGLDWDEGPKVGGEFGPYFQTERFDLYAEMLERMKANGSAYPCFCSAAELESKREAAREKGGFAGYDRTCRGIDPAAAAERIAAGEPHVWRLKVPDGRGDVLFTDAVRGPVSFPIDSIEDLVLARTDGTPTYNFVVVVDDATMRISHVIRGDDHIANTPKQILIYEALGEAIPTFAHLSMIWGPDGKRLSKRHGATSVEQYQAEGYVPDAIINYLALLGWSLDGETTIIDRTTLTENFSLDRISKNPAIFDSEKLDWMNGQYLRDLPSEQFVAAIAPWLESAGVATAEQIASRDAAWWAELTPLVAERIKRLDEAAPVVAFLFADGVEIDEAAREKVLGKEGAGRALDATAEALESLDDWNTASIEGALRDLPPALEMKPKVVFQAVRVALTGSTVSPPLFESISLLGRDGALARVRAAREVSVD